MLKYLKISSTVLLLIIGIGFSSPPPPTPPVLNFSVEPSPNLSATTEFSWTLTKTATPTELEFYPCASPPEIGPKLVTFTIDVEKIEPSEISVTGSVSLKMHGVNRPIGTPFTLTRLVDRIRLYSDYYPGYGWSKDIVLYDGSYPAVCSTDYYLPYNLNFSIPYELRNEMFQHTFLWNFTCEGTAYSGTTNPFTPSANVLGLTPILINNTITVTDEPVSPPAGFSYSNPQSQTVSGDATLYFNLDVTHTTASCQDESYILTNKAKGTSETNNIFYSNEVLVYLDVPKLPTVSKTCEATATKTYTWELTKTANPTEIEFKPFATPPEIGPVNVVFTITATKIPPDPDVFHHTLSGTISITNTHQRVTLHIASVTDQVLKGNENVYTSAPLSGIDVGPEQTREIPFNFDYTTAYTFDDQLTNHVEASVDGFMEKALYDLTYIIGTTNLVNNTLTVTDNLVMPSGIAPDPVWSFVWSLSGYPTGGWMTSETQTFDPVTLTISRGTAPKGGHEITNTACGTASPEYSVSSDEVAVFVDVIFPPSEWQGTTYSPGYWKNHPDALLTELQKSPTLAINGTSFPGTTAGVNLAVNWLSQPSAKDGWTSFKCHFLTTLLNARFDPTLLEACYNDKTRTGELMENMTVAYIISLANTYGSSTPKATLIPLKDVLDKVNNNQTVRVLWTGPQSLTTFSLPTVNSFALYPNPFSDRTAIRFATALKEPVKVGVYDLTGKKVRDLTGAGNSIAWNGKDNNGKKLSRGVYIVRLENSPAVPTVKALICR